MKDNPFFEIYVGERINSQQFLTIFSPKLVKYIGAVFSPGNVVLTGVEGSGKSMLLSLLKPSIRLEYFESGEEFPIQKSLRKFISSNVNLAHSNVIDFGYRKEIDSDVLKTELLFGDFLNYLIVDDFLSNLELFAKADSQIRKEVGLNVSANGLDDLASAISKIPVWEDWFAGCNSFGELKSRLRFRLVSYRRYLHKKDTLLDPQVRDTTTAIGEPIIELVKLLKAKKFIDADTNVFVDIDQYEELGSISSRDTPGKSVDYRAVINKALSSRSPHISYRIGTRGYSWKTNELIHGTHGNLEQERHYKKVDLDTILKRQEIDPSRTKDVFGEFAKDVFRRRLCFAEYKEAERLDSTALEEVYGNDYSPKEKLNNYFGLRSPERYVKVQKTWSPATKKRLKSLARKDLFSAKLGELWLNQKGDRFDLDVRNEDLPWEKKSSRWWKKERAQALVMLVASQSSQKMIWGGARELIDLSGGSILTFLSINQFIWHTWLRNSNQSEKDRDKLPIISISIQSVAIFTASRQWVEMIAQQTGRSAERLRFVKHVATFLRKRMIDDKKMSYPGGNGFSVSEHDLDETPEVSKFLKELSDYGNVLMLDHTTKSNDRRPRKKFYFNPVFCPYFGVPFVRTKEPIYVGIPQVVQWMHQSGYRGTLGSQDTEVQENLI